MPKFSHVQNNFLKGEVSPRFFGRTETKEYQEGAEDIYNKIVLPQGGVQRRPGAQFVAKEFLFVDVNGLDATLEPLDGKVRIFPFSGSNDRSYLVVMKFKDGVTSVAAVDTESGESINVHNVLTQNFAGAGPGGTNARFNGFVNDDELDEIHFAQTGDLIFFVHPNYDPFYMGLSVREETLAGPVVEMILKSHQFRTVGDTSFANASNNVAYEPLNAIAGYTAAATLLGAGLFAGAYQITMTGGSTFDQDHIGRFFKATDGGNTRTFLIISVSDSFNAIGELVSGSAANFAGAVSWQNEAWTVVSGFPRTIAFHEQRALYGGTASLPDTMWGSQTGDIFELRSGKDAQDPDFGTVVNTDAFEFTLASNKASFIQWFDSSKSLTIGTGSIEYIASGSNGAIGPLDIGVAAETSHGSSKVQPVRAGNQVVFVQASGQKIRQFIFNRDENAYVSFDLTIPAEHIVRKSGKKFSDDFNVGIKQIQLQEADNGVIWMLDKKGGLLGFTYNKEYDIRAFHLHGVSGSLDGGSAVVTSIAVVGNRTTGHDDLWMTVKRTVDGSSAIYLERIGREYTLDTINNDFVETNEKCVYLDSAVIGLDERPEEVTDLIFASDYRIRKKPLYAKLLDPDLTYINSFYVPLKQVEEVGDVEIVNDLLDLSGGGLKSMLHKEARRLGNTTNGTFRTRLEFDYSGSPAFDNTIFTLSNPNLVSSNFRNVINQAIVLYHASDGVFRLKIYDDTGAVGVTISFASYVAVADTITEIELNWDTSLNELQLFVDGVQIGATEGFPFNTIKSPFRNIVLGASGWGNDNTAIRVEQALMFEGKIHTSGYTPADTLFYQPATVFDGFDHLEGETVNVVADGVYQGEKVVSSGQITIDQAARSIVAGLSYRSFVRTLPLEMGSQLGSAMQGKQRGDRVLLRLSDTIGAKFGKDEDNLQEINFRDATDDVADPIPIFSGDKIVQIEDNYKERLQIVVAQDLPFPMTLNAINTRGQTND